MIEDSRATKGRKPRSLADLRAKSMALYSGLIGKKDVNFSLLRDTYFGVSLLHLLPSNIHSKTVCMLSRFGCVQLFATLWTVARQAPLSMGFWRQEYWSGLLCPLPGDLPNPGIKPVSPAVPTLQADSLPLSHWESPLDFFRWRQKINLG